MVQCSWRRRRRRGRRRERLKMRSKNISLSDNPCGNIWSVAPSWAAGASTSIKKKTWEFQQQQQLATTTAKRLMTIKKCGLSIMWHTILMPGAKIRLCLSVCLSVCLLIYKTGFPSHVVYISVGSGWLWCHTVLIIGWYQSSSMPAAVMFTIYFKI